MNPTRARLALAGTALALLVACGDADPAGTPPSPSSAAPASRTAAEFEVGGVLKNMVTAQESYFLDHQRYTGSVADLRAEGFDAGDVRVSVVSASATAYCMTATRDGLTLYYDSAVGVPGTEPCT